MSDDNEMKLDEFAPGEGPLAETQDEDKTATDLAPVFDVSVNSGRHYYLVSRAEEIEIPRIAAFRSWVTRHFAGT